MADDLRARLIAAELAADANPWIAHTNEEAADLALAVVADWLRAESDRLMRPSWADASIGYIAGHLDHMADELTQPSEES